MSGRAEALALARVAVPYFLEQWEATPNQTTKARLDSALHAVALLEEMEMNAQIERAARVLVEKGQFGVPWEDASDRDRGDAVDLAKKVLAAADAVMFSDDAVERAAKHLYVSNVLYPWEAASPSTKKAFREQVRAVIAALEPAV